MKLSLLFLLLFQDYHGYFNVKKRCPFLVSKNIWKFYVFVMSLFLRKRLPCGSTDLPITQLYFPYCSLFRRLSFLAVC